MNAKEDGWNGYKVFQGLNLAPPEGRGMSEPLSLPTEELRERLSTWKEQAEVFQE